MRVPSWTLVVMVTVALGGCGEDDKAASEEDSPGAATAVGYFGTGINGAAAVGTRFYAYTSDTHPVQPDINLCLAS